MGQENGQQHEATRELEHAHAQLSLYIACVFVFAQFRAVVCLRLGRHCRPVSFLICSQRFGRKRRGRAGRLCGEESEAVPAASSGAPPTVAPLVATPAAALL